MSPSPSIQPPPRRAAVPEAPRAEPLQQQVRVDFTYPVYFTRGLFHPANPVLAEALRRREPGRRHRCLVVVDDGVAARWPELPASIAAYFEHHLHEMELVTEPRVLAGGEAAKHDARVAQQVVQWTHDFRIDRQSYVVCIGGGALLDAVGYAAAIAHRGVRLVRVPTTVLSQNDSAVGVKNGINAFGKKNYVGTFAPPFAVLNDLDFLRTLEPRDVVSGMSEAVKVALIRDGAFFRWLEEAAEALGAHEPEALEYLIRRCAELHLAHIGGGGDPFELGSARPLDFGHWAAHKLEALTGHRLRHGEAVAIGVALDTLYSAETGHLSAADAERVLRLLRTMGFRLWDDALEMADADGRPAVLEGLREFREHLGGELTVTLLRSLGEGFETHQIDEARMAEAVRRLRTADAAA